ncbi:hypothetical protein F240042I4_38330 [Eisenbergiella tayi]
MMQKTSRLNWKLKALKLLLNNQECFRLWNDISETFAKLFYSVRQRFLFIPAGNEPKPGWLDLGDCREGQNPAEL